MQGQIVLEKNSFVVSLPNGDLASSYGQMAVCRRPDCDRAAAGDLGFCADDHAAYVRSRRVYASLAQAAQVVHAPAFAVVPAAQRQMLAEYLVAVACEGLSALPADLPRSIGLVAAALVARGPVASRVLEARAPRRLRVARGGCVTVGGRA